MLNSDDFEIGMFFTVLNDNNIKEVVSDIGNIVTTVTICRFQKGGIYKIIKVERPFIVYEYYARYTTHKDPTVGVLDTREVDLIKISNDYVRKLLGKGFKNV